MAMTVPAKVATDARPAIVLVSIAMFGFTGVAANMLAMLADVFLPNVLASIWGHSGLDSGLGGVVFALMTGWLVDRYTYVPVFSGLVYALQCLFIIQTLLGPPRPIDQKAQLQIAT